MRKLAWWGAVLSWMGIGNENDDAPSDTTFAATLSNPCVLPDCRITRGDYIDHDGNFKGWWAFLPARGGAYDCGENGCPLYVWIDGTYQEPYQREPDQLFMFEMVKRGFVAVNVEYDESILDYPSGCGGGFFKGFDDKSREIFSGSDPGSVVSQLCDGGRGGDVNCDLGIATHGWSQGAHIAGLAGNHDSRVTASLLFGSGNDNSLAWSWMDPDCMISDRLTLPRERRRSIAGEKDFFFGGNYWGVLNQQIETSGYDCRRRYGFHWTCFDNPPYGGGYCIVPDGKHGFFLDFGADSSFMRPDIEWGLHKNLDWLARVARIPKVTDGGETAFLRGTTEAATTTAATTTSAATTIAETTTSATTTPVTTTTTPETITVATSTPVTTTAITETMTTTTPETTTITDDGSGDDNEDGIENTTSTCNSDGFCQPENGENCLNCAFDCAGMQRRGERKRPYRFCCGDGIVGVNPVGCDDRRCTCLLI